MEVSDVHVRVLFDFEYTTKDGKEVTIKSGEKLYLIKKTNDDWWQVIRNTGRPFYVPASYIEEIPRGSADTWSRRDEWATCGGEGPPTKAPSRVREEAGGHRARSCSVESQQTHEAHTMKPEVPKRTVFDTRRQRRVDAAAEEAGEDEEADYVNVVGKRVAELDARASLKAAARSPDSVSSDTISNVDRLLESISNNLITAEETFTNGYSHVSLRPRNAPPRETSLQLNLSNSLEELTQEIELKAQSIGVKSNAGYSKVDFVKSISKDMPVSAKNLNDANSSPLKQVNQLAKINNDLKNKLQYSGSFKTKHEREKWAKNCVLLSSTREEELAADAGKDLAEELRSSSNDSNNNVSVDKSTEDLSENANTALDSSSDISRSDHSDILRSDKSAGADTKGSSPSNERVEFRILGSNASESSDKLARKSVLDSSVEDFDRNSVLMSSRLTPSDRGSTDSLLDVDHNFSIQEGSICTTASDSLLQTSDTSEECLPSILRQESSENEKEKRKSGLKRHNRVEYNRRYPIRGVSPPVPEHDQLPSRQLFGGWAEYSFTDGRIFFYNRKTGEKSWKPPRRRCNTDDKSNKNSESTSNLYSGSSSPLVEGEDNSRENLTDKEPLDIVVPPGWRLETDLENSCQCYVNIITGAKWFSSNDAEGRVYYFEENSSESSWTLPPGVDPSRCKKFEEEMPQSLPDSHIYSNLPVISRSTLNPDVNDVTVSDNNRTRALKAKSMILEPKLEDLNIPTLFPPHKWPQLMDGQMPVLKEGPLNRTKITENGKRLRKNWSSSHVVLTELLLLFFKDTKSFAAGISGQGRPEISIDLNGAVIDKGDKVSSRKNVYIVSTVLGTQILIQNDCAQQAHAWQVAIQSAINALPACVDSCPRFPRSRLEVEGSPTEESKKMNKVARSKSIKATVGSIEDLTVSSAERQTKIKARLKKFFHRRPTMEALVKKGIWKDEPAFGCYLDKIAGNDSPRVPLFVKRCINCIEGSEENMKTDGLYRASGNLSQVQKIRLQVDQNNLSVIEEEEDVHVLTGALKLFFRELKEPLIPYQLFHKAIKASHNQNKKEKISQFREIIKALPTANCDTLKFLLQHLLRVTKYKEYNRMHIPNIAIVFGPTLMWPEQESNNMALDLMQQNLVIECLLVEYENIFR